MNFEFHDPIYLWLLLLIPIIGILKGKPGNQAASILFSSTAIAKKISRLKRSKAWRLLLTLRLFALAALIVALARPQFGKAITHTEASGIDIVLALDLSSSMLGLDLSTRNNLITRIDVSKSVMKEFIKDRPNDRIGLIAFAGNPYLVSPLTLNHDWLLTNLERLQVGLIEDGTAIGDAIAMSVNRLKDLPSKSRVIVLLTDGDNNAGQLSPLSAAEVAAAFNSKVYTIAVGKGGIIPTLFLDRNGKIAKNQYGKPEIGSSNFTVDEKTLVEIAEITGAKSYQASDPDELRDIYREINRLETSNVKLKTYSNYKEAFMMPLILALFIIGIEKLLSNTRFRRLP